jgi:CDP-glycerol glycerophosphotransferase (TagB/SpsB family)
VPVNKLRLVFISFPDAADNSWHLYRYMVEHVQGHEFVWLCEQPSGVRGRIEQENQRSGRNTVMVARRLSLKGIWLLITARLIFTSHGVPRFVGRACGRTVVNLWHGMPIKVIGYLDQENQRGVTYCDYTLSTSPLYTRVMAQAFKIPESHVLEVGLPRNDALVTKRTATERAAIIAALGIEAEADVIFWLPTYRRSGRREGRDDSKESSFLDEWHEDLFQKLDAAAQATGRCIVIKLHPLDRLNGDPPKAVYKNVKFFTAAAWRSLDIDLYDGLAISAALISDISSVLIDYVVTNKPMAITIKAESHGVDELIPSSASILMNCQRIEGDADLLKFITSVDILNRSRYSFQEYNSAGKAGACAYLTNGTLRGTWA